jgi:hypothetical protein
MNDEINELRGKLREAEHRIDVVVNVLSGQLALVDAMKAGLHGLLNVGAANELLRTATLQHIERTYASALFGSLNSVYTERLEVELDLLRNELAGNGGQEMH